MGQALSRDRPGLATSWQHVIPFFAFAPEIRKMIYTTNAVEALHRSVSWTPDLGPLAKV